MDIIINNKVVGKVNPNRLKEYKLWEQAYNLENQVKQTLEDHSKGFVNSMHQHHINLRS